MATDLHPDIVNAISDLADTKLGRRYDRFARRRYGVPGWKLAGKTVAGEFGGRSTKSGRGVVSSAGARGPAQFIPSTRKAYMDKYGVDPWAGDPQAIKGMMLHHLNTGVEGYNPGMPTYKDYILGQRLNPQDRRALRSAGGAGGSRGGMSRLTFEGPTRTNVGREQYTIPGQSFAAERRDARRELLLGGDLDLGKLLEYKSSINSLRDVPARKVSGDLKVSRTQGADVKVPTRGGQAPGGKGGIYEVFHDPLGKYWDSGGVQKGQIGGHSDHVHVSADKSYVERLGKLAQGMGLSVGEQDKFGGRPSSGHTDDSYHYKGMAIDVSGDKAKLRKFARIVMREARHGRGK